MVGGTTDKKLARQFVLKVGPLERSKNPIDRVLAKRFENELKGINAHIPKPTPAPKRLSA